MPLALRSFAGVAGAAGSLNAGSFVEVAPAPATEPAPLP